MKQIIKVLCREILNQMETHKSNIVRIEGIDNPIIYYGVCESIKNAAQVEKFVPKIACEKFLMFQQANCPEWNQALAYLHQGDNYVYSTQISDEYAENSYVDFKNAITKWRNESANVSASHTTLILLMGTEAAQDTGGLADTSFVISPREILTTLSKDYSIWFADIIEKNAIYEEYSKALHTIYKALFANISTDIFKLSGFIDSLDMLSFSSVQEVVSYICETLNTTWGVPSIVDKKAIPKESALNKGTINSAKIITSAVRFIERTDDIPTAAALKKLHNKFVKYAEKNDIVLGAPFPEEDCLFDDYNAFEKTVTDFMRGINLDANREKLLKLDYAIINEVIGMKLPKESKEKAPIFSGTPVEVYSKMFLKTVRYFYDSYAAFPTRIVLKVDRISMSDCTEDQKDNCFLNVCNFVGGILCFFNDIAIDVDGKILTFEYEDEDCTDPFDFANYSLVSKRIKSSGKWGDPCKVQFILTASNDESSHKYEYKWAFSPYSPWLNAFNYLANVLDSKGSAYVLPTLVSCQNIQDYIDCESQDEFYAHLQQFRGKVLYDEHKAEIRAYFNKETVSLFDLVCNNFKNFALGLTQHGLFNSGKELRILVQSYTRLMQAVHDHYESFNDVQKEKLSLLVNCFTISSNAEIVRNDNMEVVIIPAYNPIMLEKIDAQQLFLRRGFEEIMKSLMLGNFTDSVLNAKLENLIQLSSITQAADTVRKRADEYLICKNMWEYFGVYFGANNSNDLLSNSTMGLSIITDEEDSSAMLHNTPMSNIIIRNVLDYVHTFPARVDGLNIAFIAPADIQHIVSAIHSIAKALDNDGYPATISIKIICLNSKKNSATYLRRWLDSYFSDDRSIKVNTFLHNSNIHSKSDVDELKALLSNYDLCFTYNILQSAGIQFDRAGEQVIDMNYEKFPMTFTPDTIPATHGKARKVNISQFQFLAAMQHTQASHIAGHPHSMNGIYRAYRMLELPELQEAIIEIAHKCCKWVVCVDQAIDRHMLEETDSKIIGFTTGEGSYGELNVTVSARKDVLVDIKQMLRRRITEKFVNWDTNRLQRAADYCVDELSQHMDGSRILKALNPYDYEIHSFLAYILTLQMLELTKASTDYIVRALISLDSYKHWFIEDDQNIDNKRPDFLLIEIPHCEENISAGSKLKIHAKVIECKMGFKNDSHIAKARQQLEKGLRTLSMNWRPDATGVMHRYWLNQLYRAIIFSPLNMDNTTAEYVTVREKIYGILNGEYDIDWTGDIFAFWLDMNDEIPDEGIIYSSLSRDLSERGISIGEMKCHNCGQMFIQKMLLPEEDREDQFLYNDIYEQDESNDYEDVVDFSDSVAATGLTIPKPKDIYVPFIKYLSDQQDHTRQTSLQWCRDYFSISETDCKIVYESNGHFKWETAFDSVITDFRKEKLLENSQLGSFHITELGQRVARKLELDQKPDEFFAVVIKTKEEGEMTKRQADVETEADTAGQEVEIEVDSTEQKVNTRGIETKKVLEEIRVLVGKDKRNGEVYWEFGHSRLANRHILITGTSGQGKTYAIQAMILELARQSISSIVFDYTDGFLPGKLEPAFEQELNERITQEVAILNRIPVNPFRLQTMEIPPFGRVPEKSSTVAGRISDILKHVYSFGDQQAASIYAACKQGVDHFGDSMDFAKLRQLLDEMGTPQSKSVLSKMAQFFDMDLFDSSREFDWKEVTQGGGKVTVIQLTGLDRELQTVVTEIMMWDAWYSLTKFGNKNTPFVVVLDEAQNLSFKEKSPAEKILREGRKYGWSAWFATQFLKGALDSGEISNLQQAAERLYFKPTGEEMSYIADQIADNKSETAEWLNVIKGIQKGQCIVQGDRLKSNGQFGAVKPALVNVSSFEARV